MKIKILIALLFGFSLNLAAQKPETVYSIAKVLKPHKFYVEQAGLWWKETQKNPSTEEAWFNYFKACRMARITFSEPPDWKSAEWKKEAAWLKGGNEIVDLIERNIPGTFTFNYVKWWNHGADPEMFPYLLKAYELNPKDASLLNDFVVYYETQGNLELRRKYNTEWFRLNDLSPGLLSFSYNVLQSMDQGAILVTGGDNDTFPVWMLQDALGLRRDAQVLNLSTLNIQDYRNRFFGRLGIPLMKQPNNDGSTTENNKKILEHILRNKPAGLKIYLSMSLWKGYYSDFESKLYIVGNILQFSETELDNISLIEKNILDRYVFDYLKFNPGYDVSAGLVDQMNVNYLPAFIKLYQHYSSRSETAGTDDIREKAMIIAGKAGGTWKQKAFEIFN